ncbi:MAG: GNAT family N-acetyltransferase, partial [Pseudonocardia sp.]|nr:GNAT family N-acetyltransferase [Pseudonocardia sp.]
WRDRGAMTPEHGRARFLRHLAGATEGMVHNGQAALCEYTLDGDLVASSLLVIGPESVGGYLYGADPALFGRFNVTTLMMRTAMEVAVERAVPTFSMLRGREDYKTGWRPETTRNDRLVLVRPGSVAGAGYARSVRARSWAIARVRTHAPALRSAAERVRRSARNPRLVLGESRAAAVRLLGRAGRR